MLALLFLSACELGFIVASAKPKYCEAPEGKTTVTYSCPDDDELAELKRKAREGDPEAQMELSFYYAVWISPQLGEYYDLTQRAAADLARCAAKGGSDDAARSARLGAYLDEPDASKTVFKHVTLAVRRNNCSCNRQFSSSFCQTLCRKISITKEKLSPAQIAEVEKEISTYQLTPTPCDLEILKE
jgi:hypothetical protein